MRYCGEAQIIGTIKSRWYDVDHSSLGAQTMRSVMTLLTALLFAGCGSTVEKQFSQGQFQLTDSPVKERLSGDAHIFSTVITIEEKPMLAETTSLECNATVGQIWLGGMGSRSAAKVFQGGTRQMDKLFARLCEKTPSITKGSP
jgi:hypothetical protein